MLLNFFNIFIIFIVLFGLLWFFVSKTKNKKWSSLKRSDHIKVIDEGIQMGFGQRISIIKIENEYFAFTYGQSGTGFQPLKTLNIEDQQTKWEREVMGEEHRESFIALGEIFKNEK